MKKGLLVGIAIALMSSTNAFAHGGHKGGWGGDQPSLNGTYLFDASGFADLGSSAPGQAGVLGTLTIAGTSITENLTMTAADGGQYSCSLTGTGTYTPATSTTPPTMSLEVGTGLVNFVLLIPNPSGKWADALESDSATLTGVTCGDGTINTMVLKGHLKLVSQGWDH